MEGALSVCYVFELAKPSGLRCDDTICEVTALRPLSNLSFLTITFYRFVGIPFVPGGILMIRFATASLSNLVKVFIVKLLNVLTQIQQHKQFARD